MLRVRSSLLSLSWCLLRDLLTTLSQTPVKMACVVGVPNASKTRLQQVHRQNQAHTAQLVMYVPAKSTKKARGGGVCLSKISTAQAKKVM